MTGINVNMVASIVQDVKLSLQNDIVSRAELQHIVRQRVTRLSDPYIWMEHVLNHLLTENVQIGYARSVEGKYVKFVAWKGSIDERITRARREVESIEERDRDFAFWICFSSNVDEYEP